MSKVSMSKMPVIETVKPMADYDIVSQDSAYEHFIRLTKRNHRGAKERAEAMLPEHLQDLFEWMDSEAGKKSVFETECLMIKALLSTGFVLMGRYLPSNLISRIMC